MKQKLKSSLRMMVPGLALRALLLLPLVALAAPPDHAPAHGYRAQHHYVYYPQKQIYYAPESQMWFWLDGGSWSMGATLPMVYQQYTRGGYNVYLDADKPYEEHQAVVEGYRHHKWKPYRYGAADDQGSGPRRGGGKSS